jgi:hypothetical protein|tara:strand:+ start:363 stop:494 length:132 start_codon:yes stop_codon:yes gene_type:complete
MKIRKNKFIHWINTTDEGQIFSYWIMFLFVSFMGLIILTILEA